MIELALLVADRQMGAAVSGIIHRPQALGISPVTAKIYVHPNRDPGVFHEGARFAQGLVGISERVLLLLDCEWSGSPGDRHRIEAKVEGELEPDWGANGRCIAIEPELEAWVWSDSPHVEDALAWTGREPGLRDWLLSEGFWEDGARKPDDPKRAMEAALREVGLPRSASIFQQLAENVGFRRCNDQAFLKLKETLTGWYG